MMKTVYFIYVSIPQKIFDSKIKFLLSNTEDFRFKRNTMYGLYAWSTKKKIVKEFFELREPKIYTLVEKEIDSEEYFEHFKSKYSNLELTIREYDRKDGANLKTTEIVTTKNEWVNSTIDNEQNLWEFGPEVFEDIPYKLFKNKVINALDLIGYIDTYIRKFGTNEEIDDENYNRSFGLTSNGNEYRLNTSDTVNVLLYLFHFLFYGTEI